MMKVKRLRGAGATLIAVALVSGVAASALGQRQYMRLMTDEAWAAAQALPAGHAVQAADLRAVRVSGTAAALAVSDARVLVGQRLVNEKQAGELFQQGDVAPPQRLGMTDVIPSDRVIYTLVPDRQLLPYTRQLRNGDSFDILATAPGGRVTTLARDVLLLGNLGEGNGNGNGAGNGENGPSLMATIAGANPPQDAQGGALLVLAVRPEHVYPLASALGSNARISLVAHQRASAGSDSRLAVEPPPARERRVEVITGLRRSYVTVGQ